MEYMIIEEPKEENYDKFIRYACNKSNMISVKVVTHKTNEERLKREF